VTQQNAASAEESASASEEMSAQAETMKAMVNDLLTMIGGRASKARTAGGQAKRAKVDENRPRPTPTIAGRPLTTQVAEQIIPMNDEDLKEF
jgi:methyl-accepting chemotaxis protein